MKILQVSHNYHITGGSDAVFFATSDLLARNGHQVVPFCIDSPANRQTNFSRYFPRGADTKRKSFRDSWRYFHNGEAQRKLYRLIRDHGPFDAAHLHIYHGKQTPAILPILRHMGIPILHTLHEYKLACPVYTMQRDGAPCDLCISSGTSNALKHKCKGNSLLQSAAMLAEFHASRLMGDVRSIDRFLCVSGFQRKVMRKAGLPVEKLRVLHNFVEPQPEIGPAEPDAPLLYFGRLEKLKGVETLLRAVGQTGHRLVIAGDGAWKSPMLTQIAAIPNVSYVGFQSGQALKDLIGSARAVVVPSEWYENCPMSVLEAKALGVPVIGARIGGIPELVRDGRDGYLFEPGNVVDLCKAINALDAHPAEHFYHNARLDVANRFSADSHLDALLGHYSDVQPRPKMGAILEARA